MFYGLRPMREDNTVRVFPDIPKKVKNLPTGADIAIAGHNRRREIIYDKGNGSATIIN